MHVYCVWCDVCICLCPCLRMNCPMCVCVSVVVVVVCHVAARGGPSLPCKPLLNTQCSLYRGRSCSVARVNSYYTSRTAQLIQTAKQRPATIIFQQITERIIRQTKRKRGKSRQKQEQQRAAGRETVGDSDATVHRPHSPLTAEYGDNANKEEQKQIHAHTCTVQAMASLRGTPGGTMMTHRWVIPTMPSPGQ